MCLTPYCLWKIYTLDSAHANLKKVGYSKCSKSSNAEKYFFLNVGSRES